MGKEMPVTPKILKSFPKKEEEVPIVVKLPRPKIKE